MRVYAHTRNHAQTQTGAFWPSRASGEDPHRLQTRPHRPPRPSPGHLTRRRARVRARRERLAEEQRCLVPDAAAALPSSSAYRCVLADTGASSEHGLSRQPHPLRLGVALVWRYHRQPVPYQRRYRYTAHRVAQGPATVCASSFCVLPSDGCTA